VKKSWAPCRPGSYVLCDGAKYCRPNRCSFFPPLRYAECVVGDTEHKAPDNSFTGQSRIVGLQYGACFLPHFWHLEFGGGS